MTHPTPVAREDREEAKLILRIFGVGLEYQAQQEMRIIVSTQKARSIASAIRIVLEGET